MTKNIFTGLVLFFVFASVGHAATIPMAKVRLEVDDLLGNPVTSIMPGDDFLLKVFAQDIRTTSPIPGVFGDFAAYTNISYDPSLVSVNGPVTFNSYFSLSRFSNTATPGLIDAGGASISLTPPGSAEQWVFSVPLHATNAGTELFTSFFDSLLSHDFLLYGYNYALLETEIQFLSTSVTIVPEPSSFSLGAFCALLLLGRGVLRRQSA